MWPRQRLLIFDPWNTTSRRKVWTRCLAAQTTVLFATLASNVEIFRRRTHVQAYTRFAKSLKFLFAKSISTTGGQHHETCKVVGSKGRVHILSQSVSKSTPWRPILEAIPLFRSQQAGSHVMWSLSLQKPIIVKQHQQPLPVFLFASVQGSANGAGSNAFWFAVSLRVFF